MIEAFHQYVSNYNLDNPKIRLKYDHSFRVMELSKEMATILNWAIEDIELASLIGLLHDIGRFEQLRVYDTYNDHKSIDHADHSVVELFEKGKIRLFIEDGQYDDIIRLAIKNHNKLKITGITEKRTLEHAKLIRDTDKIDILYNLVILNGISCQTVDDPVSMEVLNDIKMNRSVDSKHIRHRNDFLCCWMAFAFDINYDVCLPKIKEYLVTLYDKLERKDLLQEPYDIVINYLEERMK